MSRPITECPLWRWMPGMLDQHGRRVTDVNTGQNAGIPVEWSSAELCAIVERYERPDSARSEWRNALPDPADPATVGCLLALVREAWGIPGLGVHCDRNGTAGGWVVADGTGKPGLLRGVFAETEWEALCAALWAASERAP